MTRPPIRHRRNGPSCKHRFTGWLQESRLHFASEADVHRRYKRLLGGTPVFSDPDASLFAGSAAPGPHDPVGPQGLSGIGDRPPGRCAGAPAVCTPRCNTAAPGRTKSTPKMSAHTPAKHSAQPNEIPRQKVGVEIWTATRGCAIKNHLPDRKRFHSVSPDFGLVTLAGLPLLSLPSPRPREPRPSATFWSNTNIRARNPQSQATIDTPGHPKRDRVLAGILPRRWLWPKLCDDCGEE